MKAAAVRWIDGLRFEVVTPPGITVLDGAPETSDPSPIQFLLVALAGCTAMDVASILFKKRQSIDRYDVRVVGEQVAAHPRVFAEVVVEHELEGAALDVLAVTRSVELSARTYCPVNATISAGATRVTHRYRVLNATGESTGDVCVTGPHGAGLTPRDQPA